MDQTSIINKQVLSYLGNCGNYLPDPQTFTLLTYGESLASISFLLAFIQFLRPIYTFRLQTRIKFYLIYFILFSPIFLIFFAKAPLLFYKIPLPYVPYVELIAAIITPATIGYMLWAALHPVKFKEKNCKRYLDGCAKILISGNSSDLRELANEISLSSKEIVSACKNYTTNSGEEITKAEKKDGIYIHTAYALNLLDLLSDPLFCLKVICDAPYLAVTLVEEIQKQKPDEFGRSVFTFIQQIIKQAILNQESILYRETDYEGLGHYKSFTKAFFRNYEFLESKFKPMDAWEYWRDENITLWKVKKYGKLVKIALETYFESKEFTIPVYPVNQALPILNGIASIEVGKLESDTNPTIYNPESWKILQEIASIFKDLIELTIEKSDQLPNHSFLSENEELPNHNDFSLYQSLAREFHSFLSALSRTAKFDDELRSASINPWLALYPIGQNKEIKPGYKEIHKRFEAFIFQNLQENLEYGLYPSITRPILTIFHLTPNNDSGNKESNEFKKKFFEYLAKHFKAAIEKFGIQALDLLPAHMEYVKERNCIIQRYVVGRTQETLELKLDS